MAQNDIWNIPEISDHLLGYIISAITMTMYQQYLVLVYRLYNWFGVMKQFPFLPDCEEPVQIWHYIYNISY